MPLKISSRAVVSPGEHICAMIKASKGCVRAVYNPHRSLLIAIRAL